MESSGRLVGNVSGIRIPSDPRDIPGTSEPEALGYLNDRTYLPSADNKNLRNLGSAIFF